MVTPSVRDQRLMAALIIAETIKEGPGWATQLDEDGELVCKATRGDFEAVVAAQAVQVAEILTRHGYQAQAEPTRVVISAPYPPTILEEMDEATQESFLMLLRGEPMNEADWDALGLALAALAEGREDLTQVLALGARWAWARPGRAAPSRATIDAWTPLVPQSWWHGGPR